jgi:hypothetical protein
MISKYLSELGLKDERVPWNWNPDDKRQKQWEKQREKYECDERDTWCLHWTYLCLMYPRLRFYKDFGLPKFKSNEIIVNFKDKEYTLPESIDKILHGWEIVLKDSSEGCWLQKEDQVLFDDANDLFARIVIGLWW